MTGAVGVLPESQREGSWLGRKPIDSQVRAEYDWCREIQEG